MLDCNKENMRAVVAALRTDRFKQGQGHLAQMYDGQWWHCCLGVACEIAIESGVEVEVVRRQVPVSKLFDGSDGHLPIGVQRWLGVDGDDLSVEDEHGLRTSAIAANDEYGWSFEMIADGLEGAYGLLEDGDATT